MKWNKNIKQLLLALVVLTFAACNEEFPNLLDKEYNNKEVGTQANKVVLVVVDGLRGNALSEIDPENLRIIARNSLYSNSGLGDFQSTPFTRSMGLANVFTGVTSDKHEVSGDNLNAVNVDAYPTFLTRLKQSYEGFSAVAYTTDQSVSDYLLKDAETKEIVATDAEVVNKTKEAILNKEVSLIVSHLSDIDKAGEANAYESDDPAYRQAILTFDEQINDIIGAVKQRPNYKDENWLVIITSTSGGAIAHPDPNDLTAYGDSKRNTFTYFYSPKFSRKYIVKPNSTDVPFEGNAIRYTYAEPRVNSVLTNAQDYNFASTTADFTINFFIKTMNTGDHNYPIVLAKRVTGFSGNGWNIFMENRGGATQGALGWNSNISSQTFATKRVSDGLWHSFTVVVNRSGSNKTVRVFMDGDFNASNVVNTNSLDNTAPLAIGRWAGNDNANADLLLCNLQIYNTAFSDEEVKALAGIGLVKDTHPKYGNLIGYWPGYNDVGTNKLTDVSGRGNHMAVTGPYTWSTFSDIVRQFQPDISASFYNMVPNLVDIPFFIYQWYGVLPLSSWGLDGQAWTPPFAILEY